MFRLTLNSKILEHFHDRYVSFLAGSAHTEQYAGKCSNTLCMSRFDRTFHNMRIMSRVAEELSASYDGVRLIESELYPALRVMKQESQ